MSRNKGSGQQRGDGGSAEAVGTRTDGGGGRSTRHSHSGRTRRGHHSNNDGSKGRDGPAACNDHGSKSRGGVPGSSTTAGDDVGSGGSHHGRAATHSASISSAEVTPSHRARPTQNFDSIIRCVVTGIMTTIEEGHVSTARRVGFHDGWEPAVPELFTLQRKDRKGPLRSSLAQLLSVISTSFRETESCSLILVAAIVYLRRLQFAEDHNMAPLVSRNCIRLVFCAVLIASKTYLEDRSRVNKKFAEACGFDLSLVNEMEVEMLFLLDFHLFINRREYDAGCEWLIHQASMHGIPPKELPIFCVHATPPNTFDQSSSVVAPTPKLFSVRYGQDDPSAPPTPLPPPSPLSIGTPYRDSPEPMLGGSYNGCYSGQRGPYRPCTMSPF